ncbi:enoyl-CoA hydratase/isomerase family protein [Tianweitania sp. Rool2]|uniref:Enoyl-CoA hydratase/isomerase family protein n=1 Tax=Oryzicola mucosus TaxID=2767425 RepID=A0A8J6PRL9_9HYPH|nr:enoyl-CoA hydratase/isomerase family protein [Oryzicola mucosus]
MTEEVSISQRDDHVLEIELNRPEQGNALTPVMADAITAGLRVLDPETRVVLIKAAGADFCTGRSAAMPAAGTRATALDLRRRISDPVLDFYQTLREMPVPFVTQVRGSANGVGCAIAALADVAVAADTARFQVPEMNHDIAPTLVMNALADRIPRAALARLVLTRDAVDAAEAKTLGLIGVVVADEALGAETERIVGQLAMNSVATVRAVKAFLSTAPETSFAARKELAALMNSVATAERFR